MTGDRPAVPLVALLTDFGRADAYAGVLHGVLAAVAPRTRVVDLTHDVPPQDVRAGAFLLLTAYRYFPPGTVFVAVVDPGVGSERAVLAVRAGGYLFVGPDNGLLRWAVEDAGGADAAVRVEHPDYRLAPVSATFHGRDVMAPAAAHLSRGVALSDLGPPAGALSGAPLPRPRPLAAGLGGEVLHVDRFGNCITNLPPLPGEVLLAGRAARRVLTYAEGARAHPGEPVTLAGSAGWLEVALPGGSAAAALGVAPGASAILTPPQGEPSPEGRAAPERESL
ncbi:MAG TPA: SAM-dependent chlorinase/fluorinase [Chloroflexota bacterium]|nr:SAM-dependent chlorinase/fluorinase [Chloroflexota bacterium]